MTLRTAILGSKGLVGDAFCRNYNNVVLKLSRDECDLCDTRKLTNLLLSHNIELVINCAAKVAGIEFNRTHQFTMLSKNIELGISVLKACVDARIKLVVQFSSNCAYPCDAPQPYKKSNLFSGLPIIHNKSYAFATV